ncbi:MAG: hypothetical protein IPM54_10160 [Polyangiaceae bacterium]|nr:hypothetical protein [Polyangiaceae bacterium]
MEIYDSIGVRGYEIVQCPGGYDDWQLLGNLDGTPRLATWKPVVVKRVRGSKREAFRPADLPYEGGSLILRRSAVDVLRDMLEAHGELLPLQDEGGVELYVLNLRAVDDALDEPRSSVNYVGGTDRISRIKKPVFIPSAVEGVDIFKLRRKLSQIYFSDRFVARVKAAKLKGLNFTKVWSSDEPL